MRNKCLSWMLVLALVLTMLPVAALADYDFYLDKSVDALPAGGTLQLSLTRLNGALANGKLTYFTSDRSIATVDEQGLVTAHKRGTVTVTAKLETPRQTYRSMLTLQVYQPVTNLSVKENWMVFYDPTLPSVQALLAPLADGDAAASYKVIGMLQGATLALDITPEPWDASVKGVKVSSSDESVVRVVDGHTLYAAARGDCVVTIASEAYPEVARHYRVLVIDPVRSISVTAPATGIYNGDTLQATAAVGPAEATIKDVRWTSSNPSVAMVDEQGTITGLTRGTAVIRATAVDGSDVSGAMEITVRLRPEAVVFEGSYTTVAKGYATQVKATVLPEGAEGAELAWASSDSSIAVVNDGTVVGVNPGVCVVTASSKDFPNVSGMHTVQVREPVQSIVMHQTYLELMPDQSARLGWTIVPAQLQDTAVEFTSTDATIAYVDEYGTLHALKAGNATITARVLDGTNRAAHLSVYVRQPVTGVKMARSAYAVQLGQKVTVRAVITPENANDQRMYWSVDDPSVATVSGYGTKPSVTGLAYGVTTLRGSTVDGGFRTSCKVYVYDASTVASGISITELYVSKNAVKLAFFNGSTAPISRFDFRVTLTDQDGEPLICTSDGKSTFTASYRHGVNPGASTVHGSFTFDKYKQPSKLIGKVELVLESCTLTDGTVIPLNLTRTLTVE